MPRPLPALFVSAAACGTADLAGVDPVEAEARTVIEGYSTWDHAPSWPGVEPSDSVHGAFVQIWCNDLACDALATCAGSGLPAGSVVVKEAYDDADGEALLAVTAMWKSEAGWRWVRFDADDAVTELGEPEFCVSCHAAGADFILSETW